MKFDYLIFQRFILNFFLIGISYTTHPQGNPTRVADFVNIEKITTTSLQISNAQLMHTERKTIKPNAQKSNLESGLSSPCLDKKLDKMDGNRCTCNEIKTILKIKVKGNSDDLTITCNGIKAADSIADLVDGYCRIVNDTDVSYWERIDSTSQIDNDTLDQTKKLSISQRELPSSSEQSQDRLTKYDGPITQTCKFILLFTDISLSKINN